jgi:hypothetical protein
MQNDLKMFDPERAFDQPFYFIPPVLAAVFGGMWWAMGGGLISATITVLALLAIVALVVGIVTHRTFGLDHDGYRVYALYNELPENLQATVAGGGIPALLFDGGWDEMTWHERYDLREQLSILVSENRARVRAERKAPAAYTSAMDTVKTAVKAEQDALDKIYGGSRSEYPPYPWKS